jgi:AcrR family transcriptional regulator
MKSEKARRARKANPSMASKGGPAGRPRSTAARRAVLDAAYGILVETGLSGFSVEAVASRSGVARTTIYRAWPTKGLLAMESFREAFEAQLDLASTNSPEDDLRGLVCSLTMALGGPAGRLAASVLAEAQSDKLVQQQFLNDFSTPLRVRSTKLIKVGIMIGRFRDNLDIVSLLDALVGAVYIRLMLGVPLDRDWADNLAATLLHGCLLRAERAESGAAKA